MNNTKGKYVVIASLILSVIAIGVAMINGGKDGRDGRNGIDGLGGITNYDEVGMNNVATGKVNLLSDPTNAALRSTSHRLGWTNNTGVDVIVSNPILRIIGFASSSFQVSMATSSSETATTPFADFGYPSSAFMVGRSVLFNRYLIATGTPATTTVSQYIVNSAGALEGSSTSTQPTALVRAGEAIQVLIKPTIMGINDTSSSQICIGGTSYGTGATLSNCELATSTNRGFTLQAQFDYTFRDPNQPEP